jgi:DNA-binding transcriptional ArsR family regulator
MVDPESNTENELLEFFKALADANRLKIVGLLAQQEASVEQLAALLGLGASTVSHHLSRLAKAGLVSARADGYYSIYRLETEVLKAMAQRLLKEEELPRLSEPVDLDSYDRRVLASFTGPDGRIKAFPAQEKKFQVILRHVVKAFEPGMRYSEKEVNEILLRFNDDTASLRRGLVEYKLMGREGGGGAYWRTEQP